MKVIPSNPSTTDNVSFIADCAFPSAGCIDKGLFSNPPVGGDFFLSALHCLGLATVICYDSDTFMLGSLPSGNYTVHFNLDAGMAPYPCTPGIAPGAQDSLQFTVSGTNGVQAFQNKSDGISAYFSNHKLYLKGLSINEVKMSVQVFNLWGQILLDISNHPAHEPIEFLEPAGGIYIVKFSFNAGSSGYAPLVVP